MNYLVNILIASWNMLSLMAPFLLMGFFVAGLLSVFLPVSFVQRHLGRPGALQVFKAALLGVPLPLCSCSVIPVAASLRRQGAERGATASFLATTPQTGVDSILATAAVLGGVFALIRVLMALVTGIIIGLVMDRLGSATGVGDEAEAASGSKAPSPVRSWRKVWSYGFVKLPRDIGNALLLGVLVSGFLSVWVPEDFFAGWAGQGIVSYLVVMAIGIPLYVCSTGSIPIALSLLHLGFSPGAALVFLVTGPATNAATFTTLSKFLGRYSTLVYLAVLAATSLIGGLLFDRYVTVPLPDVAEHLHGEGLRVWHYFSGVLMLGIITAARWPKARRITPV
jgi:uncharacterized membrane protein YraQ (UPF0718 family)